VRDNIIFKTYKEDIYTIEKLMNDLKDFILQFDLSDENAHKLIKENYYLPEKSCVIQES
jgi:hypothetical protein